MLRKFKIAIDGKEYLVEMEEIGGVPQPVAPVAPVAVAAPAEAAPQPAAAPAPGVTPPSGAGTKIESPMPGTILSVAVNVGDTVSVDQNLLVLEAMKMENEIVAPIAGTVTGIHVAKGEAVDVGQILITIE